MALRYRDVEAYLLQGLKSRGYTDENPNVGENSLPLPTLLPGPFTIPAFQNTSPQAMVFATVGNGAGETLEQTYDQVFITVRVMGPQNDYDAAERLAYDVDAILHVNVPTMFGATRVLFVARTGGAPDLVDYDSSDRYHFQATYITPAATGL